jgi:hypothetical protein
MATFTLVSEQWQGGSVGTKAVIGTVTMDDAGAGGYDAGGEPLDLSAFFATIVWGGFPIAISAAGSGGVKYSMIQATTSPLIVAHRDPVDAGAAQSMFEEVTAGIDLSGLVTTWIFFGM